MYYMPKRTVKSFRCSSRLWQEFKTLVLKKQVSTCAILEHLIEYFLIDPESVIRSTPLLRGKRIRRAKHKYTWKYFPQYQMLMKLDLKGRTLYVPRPKDTEFRVR